MPYVSQKQRNYFNTPEGRAKIGTEEVNKWNNESRGQASNSQLPIYVAPTRQQHRLRALKNMMGGDDGGYS